MIYNASPKVVTKPWGKELWLELNDRYCYKRIYLKAGTRTSYQYHEYKIETNYIIEGEAEVWLENENGGIEKIMMKANDIFNVRPPQKHRVIAKTDVILQEVSTPEVDDVIRIEDDSARGSGKIESEHKRVLSGDVLPKKKSNKV
ncbi:MAG: cupin 2 conserved barrel protein [uncultured bacterium]|nr:MAG: cupin 2 conserved barrel protein [uncultured bacterium]